MWFTTPNKHSNKGYRYFTTSLPLELLDAYLRVYLKFLLDPDHDKYFTTRHGPRQRICPFNLSQIHSRNCTSDGLLNKYDVLKHMERRHLLKVCRCIYGCNNGDDTFFYSEDEIRRHFNQQIEGHWPMPIYELQSVDFNNKLITDDQNPHS